MRDLVGTIRQDIVAFLEQQDELLFNEGDFQLQLGMWLLKSGHYDDVEVEYYIPNSLAKEAGYDWNSNLYLDLVVSREGAFCPVELKYPTRRVDADITRFGCVLQGVEIVKNHGAQDIVSYNFWKDVRRIEIIRHLFPANVAGGVAVMLTNDSYYPRGARTGSICEAFSTAGGRQHVHGRLEWTRSTGTSKNLPGFTLDGDYSVEWSDTMIAGNKFHYTLIEVN